MPAACTTPYPQPKHATRCAFHWCCEMPADDVTSGGTPPMISGQTIIGMGGHKRQQRRQQQQLSHSHSHSLSLSLSLCCLREVIIPPATAGCAIVTLHARRGCVNTSCSLQRLKRCLTPSIKCIDAGRAWAVRQDHSDVRVTESQYVCCDVVAWHLHTHAAPASLPFVFALCQSRHTHGQQQIHFTLDDPKSTPTSLATQRSQLPARASCRSATDAETRHSARTYFPRVPSAVWFTHSPTG
ncbi:hypothetical protein ECC02_010107 [Trypanosoma cruzi]|uniref:Uncharacterized protein n=1 Tax=Trypanosoma cruzi TaxID=5693 RepID=A0A7J6XRH9_TRYCR|nr:hypothetical protein ECC02_010107 [Trypanosoma cruzi]